jgi:hypothetical protein
MEDSKDLISPFKIPMGTRKNFYEIYRQFGHAALNRILQLCPTEALACVLQRTDFTFLFLNITSVYTTIEVLVPSSIFPGLVWDGIPFHGNARNTRTNVSPPSRRIFGHTAFS